MKKSKYPDVELTRSVKESFGSNFFHPKDESDKPYSRYPSWGFEENFPKLNNNYDSKLKLEPWLKNAITVDSDFPDPQPVMGCRRSPIVTLGINPNLTAYYPTSKASIWSYPKFRDTVDSSAFAKYCYYYRHKTVHQEILSEQVVTDNIVSGSELVAKANGKILNIEREGIERKITITIQYEYSTQPDVHTLTWNYNEPRYVILKNKSQKIIKGDLLAARLDVQKGQQMEIYQEKVGYYLQYETCLEEFSDYLKGVGAADPNLEMGEDVAQIDIIPYATPHWAPIYLGGKRGEKEIIDNAIVKNNWALRELLFTNPSVLVLVGSPTVDMFVRQYGKYFDKQLPEPEDIDSLLEETVRNSYHLVVNEELGGIKYNAKIRVVAAPHFSFAYNYANQARFTHEQWQVFNEEYPKIVSYIEQSPDICHIYKHEDGDIYISFYQGYEKLLEDIKEEFPQGFKALSQRLFLPHDLLTKVLIQEHEKGTISFNNKTKHLERTKADCHICSNDLWEFPQGCPYREKG